MVDSALTDVLALTANNFGFQLVVDTVLIGHFAEVEGLSVEMKVEKWKQGGNNDYVHVLPGPIEHTNLILKRGIIAVDHLFEWFDKSAKSAWSSEDRGLVRAGATDADMESSDVALHLFGHDVGSAQPWPQNSGKPAKPSGTTKPPRPIRTWTFREAFPVKWEGPKFDAGKSDLATETLHIAHHGFIVQKKTD